MAKIIGFSGAQGSGKSTLLESLKSDFIVDDFKVSRAVQKAYGQTLADAVKSWDSMVTFQTAVLYQKYLHDKGLLESEEPVVLVERTFADIYAYAVCWCKDLITKGLCTKSQVDAFLASYGAACKKFQTEIYAHTVLVPLMDHIPREVDENRADYSTAQEVYNTIFDFIQSCGVQSSVVSQKTVQDRHDFVSQTIRENRKTTRLPEKTPLERARANKP